MKNESSYLKLSRWFLLCLLVVALHANNALAAQTRALTVTFHNNGPATCYVAWEGDSDGVYTGGSSTSLANGETKEWVTCFAFFGTDHIRFFTSPNGSTGWASGAGLLVNIPAGTGCYSAATMEIASDFTGDVTEYCVNLSVTNNTPFRQKYVVKANGTQVAESLWVDSGTSWSYQYCTDESPRPTLTVFRTSDGDPPVTDLISTVGPTDPAWGTGDGGDSGVGDGLTTPEIDFPSGSTPATDEIAKAGFQAVYGVIAAGVDRAHLDATKANSGIALLHTDFGTLGGKVDIVHNDQLDLKALLGAIKTNTAVGGGTATESTLSAFKSANHTDLAAVQSGISANIATASALADGRATQAQTDRQAATVAIGGVNTTLSAFKSEAHSDSQALKSSVDALGSKLDSNTANLTNLYKQENKTQVQLATEYSALTNSAWNLAQGTKSAFEGEASSIGSGSLPTLPSGVDSWSVTVAGHSMELNPLTNPDIATIAEWCKGLLAWVSYAGLLYFILMRAKDSLDQAGSWNQARGTEVTIAGFGTTLPAGIIAAVVIGGAMVALAGFFLTYWSGQTIAIAAVKSNPWLSASPIITRALRLIDAFVPLDVIVGNLIAGMVFTLYLMAAVFVAQIIIRGAIASIAFLLVSSSVAAERFIVQNGSPSQVLLEYAQTSAAVSGSSCCPLSGVYIEPGSTATVDLGGVVTSTNQNVIRLWYRAATGLQWTNASGSGNVLADWTMLGITEDTGDVQITLGSDGNAVPYVMGYSVANSGWWAFGQGWLAALTMFGLAFGLYIAKQVTGTSHGEL